jgi:hypothetical protein
MCIQNNSTAAKSTNTNLSTILQAGRSALEEEQEGTDLTELEKMLKEIADLEEEFRRS